MALARGKRHTDAGHDASQAGWRDGVGGRPGASPREVAARRAVAATTGMRTRPQPARPSPSHAKPRPSTRPSMSRPSTEQAPEAGFDPPRAAAPAPRPAGPAGRVVPNPHMRHVIFIECGFGCDGHGQDSTKAAARACRNAIEFNSFPSARALIPGGYAAMRLHVKVGVPAPDTVDVEALKAVFPYGTPFVEVVDGGLAVGSGVEIAALGDRGDAMVVAVAAVTVGHGEPQAEAEGEGVPHHTGYCE